MGIVPKRLFPALRCGRPELWLLLLMLASCQRSHRAIAIDPRPAPRPDKSSFLDLQPGWRLQVISGRAALGVGDMQSAEAGLTVTLSGKDLPGTYQRAYYSAYPRGHCFSLETDSIELVTGEVVTSIWKPSFAALPGAPCSQYFRFVYSIQLSRADHRMALLAANDKAALDEVTVLFGQDPDSGCREQRGVWCAWIPDGVAVRPQMRGAGGDWVDAE